MSKILNVLIRIREMVAMGIFLRAHAEAFRLADKEARER